MSRSFKVVDIFAGPGGLAEGFSSYRAGGKHVFELALSVEKEVSAFRTLRLRAFTRHFDQELPQEYYDYVAGQIGLDQLTCCYPSQWAAACAETKQLELGAPEAASELDPILKKLARETSGNSVLVGGPPCQAYSLVGRARNRGNVDYDPSQDHRHFLYKEYIRIIGMLQPAIFVMENVKGFLSSRIGGERIFNRVLSDLRSAGGAPDSYRIVPLTADGGRNGAEFLIRAEKYGVPQARHRVILLGIRSDLDVGDRGNHPWLDQRPVTSVRDVLGGMPRLRSGLSKSIDGPQQWRQVAIEAMRTAGEASFAFEDELMDRVAQRLCDGMQELNCVRDLPPRSSVAAAPLENKELSDWLFDPRLSSLPNHETRGHMAEDLTRYAFAIAYSDVAGRSPKAGAYPVALAPRHDNWSSGKFADRFRVQTWDSPSTTVTSHISKDGHYFIHPDLLQCRSLTVREGARLQTFPDNYFFEGNRTQQYVQVGNAVPPYLAHQIAAVVHGYLEPQVVRPLRAGTSRQMSLTLT
ncbi:MAG: DNA cytosine methyltransferase [Porphyrobacter sp.]|nr:DNA cytosine methyltransferase [Porphyrobacter sp.]